VTDEEAFEANRELLFAVAYRMLGTVADAEDAVQDAWLRWSAGRHPAAGVPGQDGLGAGRTLSR
jgi:DNA-directed RNA polymerase specialized sigma24 family protein